jgi:hypothetical protein
MLNDGRQGREQLCEHPDIAVALLDVVMETEQAGLDLVGYIRDELKLTECRIILRTGQPGYAPELKVIHEYDINDYRTKAELTHTRLITTVSAALRSYEQLHALTEHRRGLELIVGAAADLMEQHTITCLAKGILTQLAALAQAARGWYRLCPQRGSQAGDDVSSAISSVRRADMRRTLPSRWRALPDVRIVSAIQSSVVAAPAPVFSADYIVLYLKAAPHQDAAIFLDSSQAPPP